MEVVDIEVSNSIGFGHRTAGSGDKAEGGTKICEEAWSEWLAAAQFVYRINPEADIYDVFNWLRENDLGGVPFTSTTLKRADREVATDCGPWT